MVTKLLTYLKHEEQLVSELITLAQRQQRALVKYDMSELENLTSYQEETSKYLREAEDQRIKLIMAWLNLPRKEASSVWLSDIEKYIKSEEITEVRQMRKNLNQKLNLLNALNNTNRLLANRARNNVSQIMNIFSNGSNQVCNVKV